ncbi:response regulator [Methylomonas montana]|uniref:response regulator n=1 Tax=Methylomonas montana TaxID=3058963 RepID=UPI002658CCA2|nr:response regulator [Methylomonas montana]WKJ91848.1 response regulator [Methylomonas montana]
MFSADRHADLQLCLLDLNLREEDGLEMLERIKVSAPGVAVPVVTGETLSDAVRLANAEGYRLLQKPHH